jgi:hypothetical protein
MTLSFTLNGIKQNIIPQGSNYSLTYPCSSKTTCHPYESDFPPGTYVFNVHGGGGGSYVSGYESPGGYSTGILSLKQKTRLYFYVGAKAICATTLSSKTESVFGGGGCGHSAPGCYSCSGGGASDIRVLNDTLNNRIIVAGGAGGSGYYPGSSNVYMIGGKGGGSSGTKGEEYSSSCSGGGPGTQTSGGTSSQQVGIFGYGGNRTGNNGCGGGGGWYGGGAGGPGACGCSAGGGGSGFIFTELNPLVSLNSSFLLISGNTDMENNYDDGRIYVTVLEVKSNETKIHISCNYNRIFISPFLIFWPYIMSF